jgi:hypothetical protein
VTPRPAAPRRGGVVYADPDPVADEIHEGEVVMSNPPTDAEIEAKIRAELGPRDAMLEGRAE